MTNILKHLVPCIPCTATEPPPTAKAPGNETDQVELALRSNRMYGSPQAARVKDRSAEVKALRPSEFDAETGLFRIHPGRIAVPCEGDVDPDQIGLDFQVRPVWVDLKATSAT